MLSNILTEKKDEQTGQRKILSVVWEGFIVYA